MPRKCARSGGCLRESHRCSTTPWSARGSRFARQCCAWQSVRCGPWRSTCRAELRQNWRTARMRQWSVVWSLASLPPFVLALASTVGFLATLLRGQQCGLTRRLSRRAYGTRLSSNVRPRNQSTSVLLQHNEEMHSPLAIIRSALLAVALTQVSSAALAVTCEELRASVESKIQDNGVTSFTVAIVNAAASAPGRVVGTCERGAKKLVYSRGPSSAPSTSQGTAAATAGAAPRRPVITECADGRVITEGSCRK